MGNRDKVDVAVQIGRRHQLYLFQSDDHNLYTPPYAMRGINTLNAIHGSMGKLSFRALLTVP